MIEISFDELCNNCEVCNRDRDCVMFRVLKGVTNIYGSEILVLKED